MNRNQILAKSSWELISGVLLLFILFLVATLGPVWAPFDPDYSESLRSEMIRGEKQYIYAPEFPNTRHLLGTDVWGYDILTMLLYGAKYTLMACFFIAALRVGIGLIVGMLLGFKRKPSKKLESAGSIPALVILYFIFFKLTFNSPIPFLFLFFLQIILIALIGLPGVIVPIQSQTWFLVKQSFIEAAKSIGATRFWIMKKHLLPHLREHIVSLFITEMIHSLNLIGQLGIFYIFLGGTIFTADPPLLHSVTHEWAGIIAQSREKIQTDTWLLFIPLAAYLAVLTSFYFISQGIDKYYERKYAKTSFI